MELAERVVLTAVGKSPEDLSVEQLRQLAATWLHDQGRARVVLPDLAEPISVTLEWPAGAGRPRGIRRAPYWVTVDLAVLHGRLECVGLRLAATDRARAVNGDLLRKVRVREITNAAVRTLIDRNMATAFGPKRPLNWEEMDESQRSAWRQEHSSEFQSQERLREALSRAVPRYSVEMLQLVAQVYSEALAVGQRPTKTVAETLFAGDHKVAERHVSRARQPEFGLLPPTTRGKAKAGQRPASSVERQRASQLR